MPVKVEFKAISTGHGYLYAIDTNGNIWMGLPLGEYNFRWVRIDSPETEIHPKEFKDVTKYSPPEDTY